MTTTTQPMTAAEVLRQIAARRVSLTCVFDGKLWIASVERVKNRKRFTKADMEVVSAIAPTPVAAVNALVEKLEGQPQEREMFEEYIC
jgi:hypothetical protein